MWVSWDGMGECVSLLQMCFTSRHSPGGSSLAWKGHLEIQRDDLQQSMPAGAVLEAQGRNQTPPMGPRRAGRKLGVFLRIWAPCLPPMVEGRMDVVSWRLSRCLKGLGVVSWSTLGCRNMPQPLSRAFLSQLGNKERPGTCFWANHFCEGFPLLCPCQLCRAHSWGLFAAGGVTSGGSPWIFGDQEGLFTLCMDKSFCVSITCRAGWPRAGGSLQIPDSVSMPMRCSWCLGLSGAAVGDLTPGRTHGAMFHL